MKKLLNKSIPHIVAVGLFALISIVMFYPELSGKALRQGDSVSYIGTVKDIEDQIAEGGERSYWLGSVFSGMPSYSTNMDIGTHLVTITGFNQTESSSLMLFWAMTGFYLMLLLMRVNPWVAMVGAVGYGLSTYFPIIIGAGHILKMWALQWVAPLIGSIWWAYRENRWVGGGLSALFAGLLIGSSHHQITYYFLIVITALLITMCVMAYRERALKRFFKTSAVLLFAAVLGIASNIAGLYYTSNYASVSTRGAVSELSHEDNSENKTSGLDRDYITQWSYGKAETFNLFIPNFMGGGRDFEDDGAVANELKKYNVPANFYENIPSYHGSQPFTEGPVYIGALIIFLALFALFLLPGLYKWWILIPTMLAIMLSWGHNFGWFTNLFIDYVPLYNKFRVPSMILVIVEWAVPLLAALGLCKLYKMRDGLPTTYTPKTPTLKALYISTAIAGGFALMSALILPSVMNFTGASDTTTGLPEPILSAMESERAAMLRADSWRSLLFVLLGAAIIWAYLKNRIKSVAIMALAITALVTFDLFGVDRRYIYDEKFVTKSEATAIEEIEADKYIKQDKSNYRVADFSQGSPFNTARTSYFHRSVGGYHAAKMLKYQELISAHLAKMTPQAYDMLNTKYFIDGGGKIIPNLTAIGNAVVVDSIIWAKNADAELEAIGSKEFKPSHIAIINERYKEALEGVSSSMAMEGDSVALQKYAISDITYSVELSSKRFVLFTEIYHQDFRVFIDGVEADAIPADYVLRGVVVPAGKHTVAWKFIPPHHSLLKTVVATSSWSIIAWVVISLILSAIMCYKDGKAKDL